MEITGSFNDDKLYTLSFEGKKGEDGNYVTEPKQAALWRTAAKSAKSLTVNGVEYTEFSGWLGSPAADSTEFKWTTGAYGEELVIGGREFTNNTDNEVVIKAEGYKDLTLKVNKDGTVNTGTTDSTVTVPAAAPSISSDVYTRTLTFKDCNDWIAVVSDIKTDNESGKKETSINNLNSQGQYVTDAERGTISIYLKAPSWGESDKEYTVVISANGCSDVTLKITIPSGLLSAPTVTIVK